MSSVKIIGKTCVGIISVVVTVFCGYLIYRQLRPATPPATDGFAQRNRRRRRRFPAQRRRPRRRNQAARADRQNSDRRDSTVRPNTADEPGPVDNSDVLAKPKRGTAVPPMWTYDMKIPVLKKFPQGYLRDLMAKKEKYTALSARELNRQIVALLEEALTDIKKQEHKPLDPICTHPYLITQGRGHDDKSHFIREAALSNPEAWQLWLALKKYHMDAYRENLKAYSKLSQEGRRKDWRAVVDVIDYIKYWTEDAGEWYRVLAQACKLVEKNPFPVGHEERADFRLYRAIALRQFTTSHDFWQYRVVVFEKGSRLETEFAIFRWGMAHEDPLVRMAVNSIQVVYFQTMGSRGPGEGRPVDPHAIAFFKDFLILLKQNPGCVAGRTDFLHRALTDSIVQATPTDEYVALTSQLFEQIFEYAGPSRTSWESPFEYWLDQLIKTSRYALADKWLKQIEEYLGNDKKAEQFRVQLRKARNKLADAQGIEAPEPPHDPFLDQFEVRPIRIAGAYHERRIAEYPGSSVFAVDGNEMVILHIRPFGDQAYLFFNRVNPDGKIQPTTQATIPFEGAPLTCKILKLNKNQIAAVLSTRHLVTVSGNRARVWPRGGQNAKINSLALTAKNVFVVDSAGKMTALDLVSGKRQQLLPGTKVKSVMRDPKDGRIIITKDGRRFRYFADGVLQQELAGEAVQRAKLSASSQGQFASTENHMFRCFLATDKKSLHLAEQTGRGQEGHMLYLPCGREIDRNVQFVSTGSEMIIGNPNFGTLWRLRLRKEGKISEGWQSASCGYNPSRQAMWRRVIEGHLGFAHAKRVSDTQARVDKACGAFEQAISLQPKRARLYMRRAIELKHTQWAPRALADCDKAIALEPDFSDAYVVRANLRIYMKDYKGAAADVNALLKQRGTDFFIECLQQVVASQLAKANTVKREFNCSGLHEDERMKYVISALRAVKSPDCQSQAAQELLGFTGSARAKTKEKVFPLLQQMLNSQYLNAKLGALAALPAYGAEAGKFAPEVLPLVDHKHDVVRMRAISALPSIAPADQNGIKKIAGLLPKSSERLGGTKRRECIALLEALAAYGPSAGSVLDRITPFLRSSQLDVRLVAARAVWRVTGRKDEALKVLKAATASNKWKDQLVTLQTIAQMGKAALPAKEFVLDQISNEEDFLRQIAILTAIELGIPKTEIQTLLETRLRDSDALTRMSAALALHKICGDTDRALKILVSEMNNGGNSSHYACEYLAQMGAAAKPALPALKRAKGQFVTDSAIRAVEQIEEGGK